MLEHECASTTATNWPTMRREVCLVHIARGIKSLQDFRGPDAGVPIITQVAIEE